MKLRRYWRLIFISLLIVAGLLYFGTDTRIIAYTVDPDTYEQDIDDNQSTLNLWGDNLDTYENSLANSSTPELFSLDYVHALEIEIDESTFENMLLTYDETGEKEFFPINITIDGTDYEEVGIRLKGNSSLGSALANIGIGINPGNNDVEIPFLIKLNEYHDYDYQGLTQFSLRNGFKDAAFIHEVLSYKVLDEMGIVAPHSSYTGVSFNGDQEVLYVITEIIKENFVETYLDDPAGDLFKTSIGARVDYLGEDPLEYLDMFELKTNENDSDYKGLIDLFEFLIESDDSDFENSLNEWIDMDNLLTYMAFCNITVNMDSFTGNGNNYYWYQNPETEIWQIIPWDLNETFGNFWSSHGFPYYMELNFESNIEESEQNSQMGPPPDGMLPPKNGQNPPTGEDKPPLINEKALPLPEGVSGNFMNGPVNKPQESIPEFISRLLESEDHYQKYIETIKDLLEGPLSEEHLNDWIDQLSTMVLEANEERGFISNINTYNNSLKDLREFITARIEFLEGEL